MTSKPLRRATVALAALAFAPVAVADGGPSPQALEGGAGVTAPSGDVRYVTVPAGRLTTLEAIETYGGTIGNAVSFRGGWGIPAVAFDGTAGGLSSDGSTLVLVPSGIGSCNPAGCTLIRPTTSFQVIDTKTLHRRQTIKLKGDYAFDALSPNARRLYLIEHASATDVNRYIVRAYDLRRHRLLPEAIADRSQRGWVMQGSPMARATSTDGRYVYTLYTNPGGYPFVHALDTVAATAHCVGLPWTGDQSPLWTTKLTLRHDGLELAIDTGAAQPAFTIDTVNHRLVQPGARPHDLVSWRTLTLAAAPLTLLLTVAARRKRRASSAPA